MAASIQSPISVTPSRSFQSFPRSQDSSFSSGTIRTPTPVNRSNLTLSDSFNQHSSSSSQTTSTSSASATPVASNRNNKQHYQRPSTLHGLKHKLHSSPCPKALHAASPSCTTAVPNRRKSVGHIPLSPLARTPSPSPLPASPTRSPSPLAFPVGHQPGSSNTTQSYSPSAGTAPIAVCNQSKKGFVRPKGAEPGSPLLRRALSPDRLHPRSAESKCSISPLCSSGNSPPVKAQARSGSTVWRPNAQPEKEKETESEASTQTVDVATSTANSDSRLSLNLSGPGELLPRIAEEKDSPTNNGQEDKKDKCDKVEKNKNVQQRDKKEKSKCDKVESCNKSIQEQDKSKKCDKTAEYHKSAERDLKKGEGSKADEKAQKNKSDNKSQSTCDPSTKNIPSVKTMKDCNKSVQKF